MKIFSNRTLKDFNTFSIDVSARYFAEAGSINEIRELYADKRFAGLPVFILGGGSNILFTDDFNGLVLKAGIMGVKLAGEDEEYYFVNAAAGENWHEFVKYCVEKEYQGIENLSLIPGNVGAAPIQNIGAYGVELKDVFFELDALNTASGELQKFSRKECRFGYRDSIFKNELKGQYIITSATFILKKKPEFNTSYGAIEKELDKMGIKELSAAAISKAVCNIRRSKLPDTAIIGNAGSFFKNPVIKMDDYALIKKDFPEIPGYKSGGGLIKTSAGWLIDKCGWKGKRFGKCGVHEDHALVLVNYGGADGMEILKLSEKIKQSVMDRFGIELEREVNVVP